MGETKQSDVVLIDRKEYKKRFREFVGKNSPLFKGMAKIFNDNVISWGTIIEKHADEQPNNIAIMFEDLQLTYKEFNELINQHAHYFISLGLKKGDVVALMMKNKLEMPVIMTALGKIGAISSLINSDFRGSPLAHSLTASPVKAFIIDEECIEAFNSVKSQLELTNEQKLYYSRYKGEIPCPEKFIDLAQIVSDFPVDNPSTVTAVKTWDQFGYVFTSGTTGLPKLVPFPHQRLIGSGIVFGSIMLDLKPGEIHYCALPLFHSNPLTQGLGPALYNGATLAIGRKFSTRNFWNQIRKFNAVSFNYIGEICRYLMNQPPKPDDADNPVKRITGNGLRPEIWLEFKKRFDIDIVAEYYGASELNSAFYNFLNFDKTCGYSNSPHAVVKYDVENDELIRNEKGFLIKVKPGETGLLIFNGANMKMTFIGYLDDEATEKKLIRGAFRENDVFINTGDLVVNQGCSHVIFADRIGDTYRWKGHNIATTEVESVINGFDDVILSCAFGVRIPGTDGRAGMAAIVPTVDINQFDLEGFAKYLHANLAAYAVPIFIRFKSDISTTSTFKLKKNPLRNEGYNIDSIDEQVHVMLPGDSKYTLITKQIYDNIQSGKYKY